MDVPLAAVTASPGVTFRRATPAGRACSGCGTLAARRDSVRASRPHALMACFAATGIRSGDLSMIFANSSSALT
ncbi:hypothetical protein [Streptomyces hokutonensis]|uniref:Uncharacterized protein n=1 Tax=Streptomyces hokutonensis TaxID=1306990 RepID=A0ABW6M5I2_9ACTN